MIDNTKPFSNVDSSVDVTHLSENAKLGKDNPIIVKALISVVIEDINYEISCSLDYLSNLESTIKRLKIAKDYNDKMLKASNDKKRQYYFEGVKSYLAPEENPEKMKLRRLRNYVFNNIKVDLKNIYYKNVFSPLIFSYYILIFYLLLWVILARNLLLVHCLFGLLPFRLRYGLFFLLVYFCLLF